MSVTSDTAWRIAPLWDDLADSIQLGYRGRSKEQFNSMDSLKWGTDPLPAENVPVLMYLHSGTWHNRHISMGRMHGDVLVSVDMRDLLFNSDPKGVHFDAVELQVTEGVTPTDRYSILKVTRTLDALVPEKSSVRRVISRRTGKPLGWNYVGNTPPTLKRDVVEGCHIWRLPNLMPIDLYVSDWLKSELERRGLGPFKAEPVPLC